MNMAAVSVYFLLTIVRRIAFYARFAKGLQIKRGMLEHDRGLKFYLF